MHNLIEFKIDFEIYLQFNREYHLSNHSSFKIFNQYCRSFKILQKIRSLAYQLKLSEEWRIHSVMLIAQLESALEKDLYKRSKLEKSLNIEINDTEQYVIKRIVNK